VFEAVALCIKWMITMYGSECNLLKDRA